MLSHNLLLSVLLRHLQPQLAERVAVEIIREHSKKTLTHSLDLTSIFASLEIIGDLAEEKDIEVLISKGNIGFDSIKLEVWEPEYRRDLLTMGISKHHRLQEALVDLAKQLIEE